jgi:glycosyltransferase involved in cell wall biosynthesis
VVAVSKFQDDTFWYSSANRADIIIPWGLENSVFTEVERDIHLLGAGSLIELKNYDLFIRLVKRLNANFPDLKCVIAGDGEEKFKLEKLVSDLSLEDNIQLAGNISREKLFELMNRSKILIHPSRFESFGYVFAEALINGMNILSRKTGAVVDSEKWITADSEEEFYHLAKKMLESNLNFKRINPFPLKKTVEMYADIYE